MRLPVAQRSSVILMDVLGCSLQEICEIMDYSPAGGEGRAASRTHATARTGERGRRRAASGLVGGRSARGSTSYVASFNARDFDAIRAMIADDVRLDLVNKTRMNGKAEVSRYFGNYAEGQRLASGAGLGRGPSRRSWCSTRTSRTGRRNISCCCGWTRRQGRDHPRFPPRALCGGRVSIISAFRLSGGRIRHWPHA